ncbi:pseudouridine synthase [Methylobacterium goesingense]|nr:pseudouridine synthase [Methylobacterium goesingense]
MGGSEDAPAKTSRSKAKASTKTSAAKTKAVAPAASAGEAPAGKPAKTAKAAKAEPVTAEVEKTGTGKAKSSRAPAAEAKASAGKSSDAKAPNARAAKPAATEDAAKAEAVTATAPKAATPKAAAGKSTVTKSAASKSAEAKVETVAPADPKPADPKPAKPKSAKAVGPKTAAETAPAVTEASEPKSKTAKATKATVGTPSEAALEAEASDVKASRAKAPEAPGPAAEPSVAEPAAKPAAKRAKAVEKTQAPEPQSSEPKSPEPKPAAPAEPWAPATDAGIPGPSAEEKPKVRHAAMPRGGDAPLRRKTALAKPAPAPRPEAASSGGPARDDATPDGDRIAKAIARAGIASRRDAEAMIEQGRVTLNGKVLASPAMNVTPDDRITVDGEPLPARERTRLWIYHKPRGLVTTARDPEGRQTVFDNLPEDLPRVVAIGRLDINTEGLLLLTNDGGLAKVIAHPDTGWLRRYRVRAHGDTTQAELDKLRRGVTIDGMDYGPVDATLDRASGDNLWLTLGLREGKNREVKRILEHLGLAVNRLIRLSFGPFQLGDLEAGLTEEIRTKVLKEQLGPALSEQAGVDFESPVREPIAPFGSPKQQAKQPARSASAAQRREPRAYDDEAARGGGRPMAPAKPARVPTGGNSAGPRRSVWRAEDEAAAEDAPRRVKIPRRGADPKAEREAAAARGRERVGAISTGERRVLVERLKSSPQEPSAEPHRRDSAVRRRGDEAAPREGRFPRAEAQARPFRQSDDRAPGARSTGERPARGFGGEGRPPRRDDDRPRGNFRSQDGAEHRGPPRGGEDRPRGPFRGNANRSEGGDERGGRPGSRGAPARDGFRGDKPSGFRGNDRPGAERGGFKGGAARQDGERGGFKGGAARSGGGKPGGGFKAGGKPGGFGGKPGGFSRGGAGGGKPGGSKPGGGGGRPPRGGSR